MKKKFLLLVFVALSLLMLGSCKSKVEKDELPVVQEISEVVFDSTLVNTFFAKHAELNKYKPEVKKLYRKHGYHYVWYNEDGITEFGNLMYDKINDLSKEGIQVKVPYKKELDEVYDNDADLGMPNIDNELLNSALYFFYTDKVYHGLDASKTADLEWYLPRKKKSYVNYLDSLLVKPTLINKEGSANAGQYYKLKEKLAQYREIEKKGGWNTIVMDGGTKSLKPGERSPTIAQVRHHLFITGDIDTDSKSDLYDKDLEKGILKYKKRNANTLNSLILPRHIAEMNIPVAQRIKTIMVNMERCRWISKDLTKDKEVIIVNIPSYQLIYMQDGEPVLQSNVVVGKALNKTVVFSGLMSYLVFSPYWNIPPSILKAEIQPGIDKNPNYLEEHNMEWHGDYVRQRPGPNNSLGLIKFMFPNTNNIYLHDSPAKDLFSKEDRASSHGCVRVAKNKELVNLILKDDENWTPEKIDAAMNAGVESHYTLKHKIPVYIWYFTAWVDDTGAINFYNDIYDRDEKLANIIFADNH